MYKVDDETMSRMLDLLLTCQRLYAEIIKSPLYTIVVNEPAFNAWAVALRQVEQRSGSIYHEP